MREFHKLIFEYIEEILYLFSFIIFNVAMFKVGLIVGLVTLSIILFIIASFVTFIKSKKGGGK
ncbi:MAG: DUF1056 family protein [Clostridium celatum]|nr:DUF1056 family protein [Clostridium celatum]MDU4979852.1 DUF1056 family protein [Clostridium celatum]